MTVELGSCVVLGAAIGYSEQQIAPFVTSLRRAGYRGMIALIVEPGLARRADSPLWSGVTLLTATQWWPVRHRLFWGQRRWALKWVWRPVQTVLWTLLRVLGRLPVGKSLRRSLQIRLALHLYPPTETRYIHFLKFLQAHGFARILLSDVRDVLFQSDPFTQLPERGLAVSMEVPQHTVGTEPHNAGWVRQGYGEAMLQQIGSQQVSCSGVTYGDRASMLHYLEQMLEEILGLNLDAAGSSGMDQGIHNVLLWTRRLGKFERLETLASAVATVGGVSESEITWSPQGRLLNRDGSIASIVHQYDRFPTLRPVLLRSLAGDPGESDQLAELTP